jgi:hypothetical protein
MSLNSLPPPLPIATGFLDLNAMNLFQCLKKLEEIRKGDDTKMLENRTRGAATAVGPT